MRTEKQLTRDACRHGVFLLTAQSENRRGHRVAWDGHRRVAAGPAQDDRLPGHDSHHGIIHRPADRTIVHEKAVGDPRQPFQCLGFIRDDRFIAEIAAGHDKGTGEFAQQQVMLRSIRQHDTDAGIVRRNRCGEQRIVGSRS